MENTIEDNSMDFSQNSISDGKPYFMGDHALVRFSGGGSGADNDIFWLVDKETHTVRPFESNMALDAAFGSDLEEALKNVATISFPSIDSNGDIIDGILADFSILGPEFSIKEDGTAKPLDFSPHQLKSRYGKPIDEKKELEAERSVDSLLDSIKKNQDKTQIESKFIDKLKNDHRLMAFYISAVSYGNYSLEEIYSDIQRRYYQSKA